MNYFLYTQGYEVSSYNYLVYYPNMCLYLWDPISLCIQHWPWLWIFVPQPLECWADEQLTPTFFLKIHLVISYVHAAVCGARLGFRPPGAKAGGSWELPSTGAENWTSARAASSLNHRAVSPARTDFWIRAHGSRYKSWGRVVLVKCASL